MPGIFFDTSALGKYYHPEIGTAKVDELLNAPDTTAFISRLSVVELHSVFAKKVRTKAILPTDFELLRRRFSSDLRRHRFQVVRVTSPHFEMATRLIRRISLEDNLRTLDALQLAIAVSLRDRALVSKLVCADQNLCEIAAAEGLTVVNPELP
jgi:predicted nucleic acid-binding protein